MAANMEYARLSAIVSEAQLETLPDDLKSKLEVCLDSAQSAAEGLKVEIERLKANAGQMYFEIEKQLISCNSKLESTVIERNELKAETTSLESKLKSAQERLKETEEVKESNLSTQLKLVRTNDQLETEKRELLELLEKKNHEIERLNEEWRGMSDKLGDATTAKVQAQAKLDEIMDEDVSSKYRERRLQQEKELLNQQNEWLNKELKEKTNELLAYRKEKSSEVLSLKSESENKDQEISHLKDMVDSLRSASDSQNTKIESLIQKVKDIHDTQAQNEEQFRVELQAQSKLTELYKSASEECKAKEKELQTAVQELQKLLRQSSEQQGELEDNMKALDEEHIKKETELEEKIVRMEKELEHANDLISVSRSKGETMSEDQLTSMFPTAAATSSKLKTGMNLTQIYSSYVEASDALDLEKQENGRLNHYLDQILKEIEEKAPIMQQQREDYERCLNTVDQLSRKIDAAMLENEQQRIKTDEAERKSSQLTRENNRLRLQTSDLGQQVRILLKEVEEARGGHVTTDQDVTSSDVSSSSNLITEKLVSFRNIGELQGQNERLLSVVRELSEKKEEDERVAKDAEFAELNGRLEKAVEEIEELRAARSRQAEMVEGIVRQRDMYRVLLTQRGDNPVPLLIPGSASPVTLASPMAMSTPAPMAATGIAGLAGENAANTTAAAAETTAALKQLQVEFEQYRKDKCESERILNDQLEKMRDQVSEFRVQNAKLSSQLEFSGERFKIVQSNVEGYKKEIDGLRDRNQKYSSEVVKHQQTINTLTQDLMAAQERFSKAEVMFENMKAERDLMKSVETRLQQENESMHREQRGQNLLLVNLQTIKNNLERADFENKSRLTSQVEFLERELSTARRKLEAEIEQHKTVTNSWESQVKSLRDQLDSELQSHQKTREEIVTLKKTLQGVKQECSEAEAKLVAAEVRLSSLSPDKQQAKPSNEPTSTVSDEEVKELKSQITQNEAEIKALKDQLIKAKQQVEQHKAISSSMEENLREQNAASQIFKETTELRLKEAAESRANLQTQVMQLDKEKREILNEKNQLEQNIGQQTAELRKNLANLQNELKSSVQKCAEAESNEQSAVRDCQAQSKLAAEAQEKYEREFLLHAADMQQLTMVRQQLAGFNSRLNVAEDKAKKAEYELTTSKASWEETLRIQKDETDNMQTRCKELDQQNTLLHEQLQTLSQQLIAFQQGQAGSQSVTDISFSEEKSSEQLLEVIRFMRREKEIAETKCEVTQAEAVRHKQKCDHLERQLEDSQKNLQEERERSQVTARSAAQHQELMKNIETLNLLTDSNKLLRDEKERLEQEHQQLQSKMKQLETDVAPLQEQNRELSNKNVALIAEKDAMFSEVKLWKARTNQLVDKSNKTDSEEAKRLVTERENNQKTIAQLTEDNQRQKAEMSRLNSVVNSTQEERENNKKIVSQLTEENQRQKAELSRLRPMCANAQTEARNAKTESAKVKEELENSKRELQNVKKELEAKNVEMDNKNKTIAQVKKIGRRYKAQYEELKNEVKEKSAEEPKEPAAVASTTTVATATAAAEGKVTELEGQIKAKDEAMKGQTEEISKLKAEVSKISEDLKKSKEAEETMKTQLTEKDEKTKKLLMNARQKITLLSDKRDKQASEIDELKTRVGSLEKSAEETNREITAKYEQSVQQLEQVRASNEQLEKEKEELQKEIEQFKHKLQEVQKVLKGQQKQFQEQQQQQQQATQQVVAATERPSASREEPPPTANIKPMASPGPSSTTKPTTSSAGQAKVTASIRPMAISTATATVTAVSQTPTATVMPTTIDSPAASIAQMESTQEPAEQASETPVMIIMPSPVQPVQPTQQTPPMSDREATQESVQAVQPTQQMPSLVGERDAESVQAVQPTQQAPVPVSEPEAEVIPDDAEDEVVVPEEIEATQDGVEEVPEQVDAVTPASLPQIIVTPTDAEPTAAATAVPAPVSAAAVATTSVVAPTTAPVAATTATLSASNKRPRDESETGQEQEDRPATPEGKKQKLETVEEEEGLPDDIAEATETVPESEEPAAEHVQEIVEEPHEQAAIETVPPSVQEEEEEDDVIIVLDSDSEENYQVEEEAQWHVKEDDEEDEEEGGYEGEEEDDVYDEGGYVHEGDVEVEGTDDYEVVDAYEEGEEAEMEEEEEEEIEVEGMDEEDVEPEQQMDDGDDVGDDDDVEIIGDDDNHIDQVEMEAQSDGQPDVHQPPGNGQLTRQPPQIQIHVVPPEPDQQQQQQATSHQQPSPQQSSQEAQGQQVPMQRLPLRTERLPSLGRTLPQFSFVGQGSGAPFEDVGDDCTVPSTPTLFVPKRTDGFAEALNSPQIQHNRFQFNPPEEGPRQVLAQLATQGALGMDDTHIDILGEEEAGGRSVPTTPLQVHSPVVQFPTPEAAGDAQEESSQSVPVSVIATTATTPSSSESVDVATGDRNVQSSSVQFVELDADSQDAGESQDATEQDDQSSVPFVELEQDEGDEEDEEEGAQEEGGQGEPVIDLADDDDDKSQDATSAAESTQQKADSGPGNGAAQETGGKPKPARIVWSDSDARRPGPGQSSATTGSASTGVVSTSRQRAGFQRARGSSSRRILRRPASRGSGRGHAPSASRGGRGGSHIGQM